MLDLEHLDAPSPFHTCPRAKRGAHVLSRLEPRCPFCGWVPPVAEVHPAEPWSVPGQSWWFQRWYTEGEDGPFVWTRDARDIVRARWSVAKHGNEVYHDAKSFTISEALPFIGGFGLGVMDVPRCRWPKAIRPHFDYFNKGMEWRHIPTSQTFHGFNGKEIARKLAEAVPNKVEGCPIVIQLEDQWGSWHAYSYTPTFILGPARKSPGDPFADLE